MVSFNKTSLQHSYASFDMLETVWFSMFLSDSSTITKGQEGSSCSSKKFLSVIAWSSSICIPGKVSKVAMHIQELRVKENSTARNSGSANYYLEFGYFPFAFFLELASVHQNQLIAMLS